MKKENIIAVFESGPLHITGTLELRDNNGKLIESGEELYLCRCGHSNNKPYCDGQHKKINFQDNGEFKKPPESEKGMLNEGKLEIKVQKDGPLLFQGVASIQNTKQQHVLRKVGALCRCGQSHNSPFCDGTHTKIEFTAE